MEKKWWQREVVYQIYPRSFFDSNSDGIGDLKGIEARLDYLQDLGITAIWICPMFSSPMDDNGYDISDYENIHPDYGTMSDMEDLMAACARRNIKVILDLVINHTSDEHAWFQEALNNPDSRYRNYYIFKEGRNGQPPTNWRSVFGGNVWEPVEGEDNMFYFHSFSRRQPDLNWENPQMRQEIYNMINRWLDKGVAGFRVDAINFIKKNQEWPDGQPDGADGLAACFGFTRQMPGIEEMLQDLRKNTFDKHDCLTVSETVDVPYPEAKMYIGEDGCFSMMFDFNYTNLDVINEDVFRPNNWTVKDLKEGIYRSQLELQKIGWSAPFIENHDQPRAVSKWIRDPHYHAYEGPTALAVLYFCLRGTPFIYEGQELGMTNFKRKSIEEFDDISAKAQYKRALEEGFTPQQAIHFLNNRSRDNARTPFPWSSDANGGFSSHKPWQSLNENYVTINARDQVDNPDSVFSFYKKLIALRQNSPLSDDLIYADFTAADCENDQVISYWRGDTLILVSLSSQPETIALKPESRTVALNNYPDLSTDEEGRIVLHPYQALILH